MSVTQLKSSSSVRDQVSEAEWQARVDLAAAHRGLAYYGVADLTYNHLSLRVPGEPDKLLIKPADFIFEEVTASSLNKFTFDGEPADVNKIVADYAAWMAVNELPKLLVNADPGAILIGPQREFCRTWRNQTEITVRGNHFLQEDSPDEIGIAIADWRRSFMAI